jgi:glutathione synthase/RimK-type ligase-like ATP-grasp enzyme
VKPIVYPYRVGSEGAKELAKALGTICVYPDRKYRPRNGHLIITWGASVFPRWWREDLRMLNLPSHVGTAQNKLRTFEALSRVGVRIPEFTRSPNEAQGWKHEGFLIVARQTLTGHEGRGIVLVDRDTPIPITAPLFTKHVRHKREFRVHVFNGKAIDIAEKRKRKDFPEEQKNSLVRNWRFGWVFAHENVEAPEDVILQAEKAVVGLQLDFGAVDIAYREKEKQAYVLEVNTAPGIEGQTLARYVEAIRLSLPGVR